MAADLEIRNRIIAAAQEQFFRHGFSRISVDELASDLGMSKKTIYKYFDSKDDLVEAVTQETLNHMKSCCEKITHDKEIDFVDKLRQMMTLIAVQYSKLGRPLIEDLQKNAPHIWKLIADFRKERIENDFGNLLKEGMQKGMFRTDIDEQLVILIYSNAIQTIITPETLMHLPFSVAQVFEAIIKVLYEGMLTDEARAKYFSRQSLPNLAQQRV